MSIEIPQFHYKTTPYSYQRRIVESSLHQKEHAISAEMGLGKTKIILDTAANLFLQKKINALLIVAPISLLRNYREEIDTHLLDTVARVIYTYAAKSINTRHNSLIRKQLLAPSLLDKATLKIILINPEALISKKALDFCTSFLLQHKTVMAVDEAGKILKNIKTKQSKALLKLSKLASYRRVMTGTPITQSPLDIFAQYGFLNPDIIGFKTFASFRAQYANLVFNSGGARGFLEIRGYKNLDHLVERVAPYTSYVKKADFLDLPPKIYETRYYPLGSEQRRLYDDLKANSIAFPMTSNDEETLLDAYLNKRNSMSAPNVLVKLTRLQRVVSGYCVLDTPDVSNVVSLFEDVSKNPRIIALLSVLDEFSSHEKVIIWAKYTQEIHDIKTVLGETCVTCFGETTQKNRDTAFDHFKKNSPSTKIKYLVANAKVAGYGITLNGVSNVIYYSQDFSLETRLQSEDRCHRIGQDKPVLYIDLVAENTIDEHIRKALVKKSGYAKMLDPLKMTQELNND